MGVDIVFGGLRKRTGNTVSEITVLFLVVKNRQASAAPFFVKHFSISVNRSRLGCLPIHSIKNHQDDVFLARLPCLSLQVINLRLVEVVRVGVQSLCGEASVNLFDLIFIAVGTVFVFHRIQTQPPRVNRDEAVGMVGPIRKPGRSIAPVNPIRSFELDGAKLKLAKIAVGNFLSTQRSVWQAME